METTNMRKFEELTLSNTVREQGHWHLSPSLQLHKHALNASGANGIVRMMMMNGGSVEGQMGM